MNLYTYYLANINTCNNVLSGILYSLTNTAIEILNMQTFKQNYKIVHELGWKRGLIN